MKFLLSFTNCQIYRLRNSISDDSRDCEDCDPGEDAPFMGSLTCRSQGLLFEERIILMQIYDALNGTGILMLLCALGMVWGVMVMMKTVASHRCNWETTILRLWHLPRKHPNLSSPYLNSNFLI
mmetsp:Transcript_16191/g.23759  ORF Transcript_16191/g.23759 Transcript_16191/m.23759 type:complete len:124 (-) Transcript_16191:3159-3530(-)